MSSNGGDKGKRGKKFRPPARGKDDDDDEEGQAALLAKCDKSSEEARRHLEEARRGPVRTRSKTRMEHGTTAAEKPRGKRYGILFNAYFSLKSCVNPASGKFTQPAIHIFKLTSARLRESSTHQDAKHAT